MVSKKRKELRRKNNEDISKAASGDLSIDTLKNTVIAMTRGVREERELNKQETLGVVGSVISGGLAGMSAANSHGQLEGGESHISTISDDELLKKLERVKIDANLSGLDTTLQKDDLELGG